MRKRIIHQEPGLVVTEHFDDPQLHGFEPEPVTPEAPPAGPVNPDDPDSLAGSGQ